MRFLTPPHVYIFLQILITKKKKKLEKWLYKETTYTFFYVTLKPKPKRNLKVLKLCVPKKMAPKSQAKIKPSVP